MVMILEIIIGSISIICSVLFSILTIKDCYKEKGKYILFDAVGVLLCIILFILGLIVITGNVEYATKTISDFIYTEV